MHWIFWILIAVVVIYFILKALYWFGKAGADFGHNYPKEDFRFPERRKKK